MKLQNVITFRLSILKAISIALWAVCFYFAIIKEINNETDEALTTYAETLITDYLAGEELPDSSAAPGDQYAIRNVTADYAARHRHIRYKDSEMYFSSSYDYEPARVVTYIFKTDSGQWRELTAFTATIDKTELKQAIAKKLQAQNGLTVDPERNILITPGSDSGLYFAILPFVHPGDEVLIPCRTAPREGMPVDK